jgi:hypothetical protein
LLIPRINRWTQSAQIFAKLIRGAIEVKSVTLRICAGNGLQLSLDGRELRIGIISRPAYGGLDPRIRFVGRRRDDQ